MGNGRRSARPTSTHSLMVRAVLFVALTGMSATAVATGAASAATSSSGHVAQLVKAKTNAGTKGKVEKLTAAQVCTLPPLADITALFGPNLAGSTPTTPTATPAPVPQTNNPEPSCSWGVPSGSNVSLTISPIPKGVKEKGCDGGPGKSVTAKSWTGCYVSSDDELDGYTATQFLRLTTELGSYTAPVATLKKVMTAVVAKLGA